MIKPQFPQAMKLDVEFKEDKINSLTREVADLENRGADQEEKCVGHERGGQGHGDRIPGVSRWVGRPEGTVGPAEEGKEGRAQPRRLCVDTQRGAEQRPR